MFIMKCFNISKIFFFIAVSLILHACGPEYQTYTNYTPPNTKNGAQCIRECSFNNNTCSNNCTKQKSHCSNLAEQRANNDYNSYIQTQCYYVNGTDTATVSDNQNNMLNTRPTLSIQKSKGYSGKLECRDGYVKTIDYFRNPYFCNNQYNTCVFGCTSVYDGCYEGCGGVVTKTTVCVANCDKIK